MWPATFGRLTGSFTCHCGNTGVEREPNKSQHTNLTLEKKILPPLLPVFELATFRSRVRRSTNKLFRILPDIPHTFLSDPRSTCIFSHWGCLLCLSAYAVEIKIHSRLLIVIFVILWCASYSALRSETWSAYSVCAEILSVEHVKADNIFMLHRYPT